MREVVSWIIAQSWPWGSQIAVKKETITEVLEFFIDDEAAITSDVSTSDNCCTHLNEFSSKNNVLQFEIPKINNPLTPSNQENICQNLKKTIRILIK